MVELTAIGLPIINWFHLIATVVWIGAMTTNFLILLPSLNEALGPGPALAAKGPSPELAKLQKLQLILAKSGFALGIIILLFTGISTSL